MVVLVSIFYLTFLVLSFIHHLFPELGWKEENGFSGGWDIYLDYFGLLRRILIIISYLHKIFEFYFSNLEIIQIIAAE